MKTLLLILTLGLISCKSEQRSGSKNDLNINAKTVQPIAPNDIKKSINDTIKRFFPLEKETIKKDTLIQDREIQISIIQKSLDSYVVNEFDSDQTKNIHKYRDFQHHLRIIKESEVLVDTIFVKKNFIEKTGQEFQYIAVFHGYWFREIKGNQIELFGMISKPETDYAYAFQHFFDINSGTFEIKNSIDEEY